MDTKYMIDMLYKQAAEEQQEEPANMVRNGAALGGLMGAGSSIKKQMGPKYTGGVTNRQGDKLMKMDDKLHKQEMKAWKNGGKIGPKPEFKPVNSAGISKVKFGEKMGNLGASLKGGSWKGMLGKAALGAGAMALGGGALTALDNYGKRVEASEIIDELYKEAQNDIKCQKCGYEGKPNYNGTCPKCGLTLGQYEPEGPCGDNYRHTRENPINDFTVEELVEKAQAEEWSY